MYQRDYLLEIISQFVEAITAALRLAAESADPDSCLEVERDISALIDLDAETAMQLAPDSLVTMMVLSGIGESVSCYVGYALDRLARIYESMGDEDLAGLRRIQAKAVAESFGCDLANPPEELAAFDAEVFGPARRGGRDVEDVAQAL